MSFNISETKHVIKNITKETAVTLKALIDKLKIYRGYYTVVQRYEFYLRVVKTVFYKQAQLYSRKQFKTQVSNKQLLDAVFVICRIINVEVRVISLEVTQMTLTETLIILHITKTEPIIVLLYISSEENHKLNSIIVLS